MAAAIPKVEATEQLVALASVFARKNLRFSMESFRERWQDDIGLTFLGY